MRNSLLLSITAKFGVANLFVSFRSSLDSVFGNIVRNASLLLFSRLGSSAIHFGQTLLLARWLGVELFGLLTLVITYVTLVNSLIDLRVWETATRYISKYWVEGDKPRSLAITKLCYLIDAGTGVLAFALILLTAPLVASVFLRNPDATPLIRLYGLALLFATVNNTSLALLRVFDKFLWLGLVALSISSVQFLMILSLYLLNQVMLGSVIMVMTLSELLGGIVLLALSIIIIRRELPIKLSAASLTLLRDSRRELVGFLANTNLTALLIAGSGYLDLILLGLFTTPVQVGYFKVAKSFVALISRIGEPFYQVIYPELAKLWASDNRQAFRELVRKITAMMAALVGPATFVLLIVVPIAITLTAGESYLPAVTAARIMAVGMAINFIFLWLRPVALSVGRAYASNVALACQLAVWIVGAILLVPRMGYVGMAIANLVGTAIWVLVSFLLVRDVLVAPAMHSSGR